MSEKRLEEFMNQVVVIDTKCSYIFVGKLIAEDDYFLTLEDADVHDNNDSGSSKDFYVLDSSKHGVKKNRVKVKVVIREMISISLLEDVIQY